MQGIFGRAMEKVAGSFGGFGGSKLGSVTEVRPPWLGCARTLLLAPGAEPSAATCPHLRHIPRRVSPHNHRPPAPTLCCPPSPSCPLLPQVGSIEDLDAYYERLGTFTGLYARHIFNRMSKTVPKAIILCQVRCWGAVGRGRRQGAGRLGWAGCRGGGRAQR